MSAVQKSNVGLDIIRGMAALLVVLGHSRNFVANSLSVDMTATLWQKALLLPTSFAQESVAVFFVLSGYLVGGQVLREVAAGRFSWRVYMSKRLSRLWTVLIPGIVLTLAVDSVTTRLFPRAWDRLAGGPSDGYTALCNAAFLQETRCAPYGSNDSLWSLSYEFWFYVIFAAAVVSIWGAARRQWASVLVGILVCTGTVLAFGIGLFELIPSWLLGVGLAILHNKWKEQGTPAWVPKSSPRSIMSLAALAAVAMLASNFLALPEWARFVMVGLASAPLMLVTAVTPWGSESKIAQRFAVLGTISFSLYVFHLPLVKLFTGALAASGGFGAVGNTLAIYAVAGMAVLVSYPLWMITERRTSTVRDGLLRMVGAPNRSAQGRGRRSRQAG